MNRSARKQHRPRAVFLALGLLALAACAPARRATLAPAAPSLQREFRGVWVATVSNIDWPSRSGLPADVQKAELLTILDRAQSLNLNAVIFQVRPAADALYASPLEPWSEYVSGEQGRSPGYDPLAFAVQEAHRRGLELHAWFNPYRARHPSAKSPPSADHLSRTRPDLVRTYGTHLWMDPGEPEVQDRSAQVILDVVRRYDVDGVHIDDYFYPYRERDQGGALIDFPDSASYARYRAGGGRLERDDWRRSNVDALVERLHREIRREKPWVRFGISPFGIWRPGHPPQICCFDPYEQLYADSRRWLHEGWLDYFTPQLYWPIAQTAVSYPILLRWWVEQNRHGRHLWPGNFTSRVAPNGWPAEEILGQIYVTRAQPGATGNVHFSARSLLQSPDSLAELLASTAYAQPALVPASPWLYRDRPGMPELEVGARSADSVTLSVSPRGRTGVWLWAVRSRAGTVWTTRVVPGYRGELNVPRTAEEVVVSGVSRTGNEGPAAALSPGGS